MSVIINILNKNKIKNILFSTKYQLNPNFVSLPCFNKKQTHQNKKH